MNSEKWQTHELDSLLRKRNQGVNTTTEKVQYSNSGIPVIRAQNLTSSGLRFDNITYVDELTFERVKADCKPIKGDILYTNIGSQFGTACKVDVDFPFLIAWNVLRLQPNDSILSNFLVYVLNNPETKEKITSLNSSSTMPFVSGKEIGNVELNIPHLPTQRRIASILTALDDKIELNRRMNETLEGIAQAVWGEWFGKYASGLEELPEGWQELELGKLVESVSKTYKFTQDKIIFLNTSDILDGQILTNEYSEVATLPGQAKKSIQRDDILYSEIRPANKRYAFVNLDADEFVVSTKLMVLRSTGIFDPLLIYFYLTRKEILEHLQMLAESRSGTFPQITFDHIKVLKFRFPDEKMVEEFTSLIKPLYEQKFENETQSRTLTALRDTLLPRLMQGDVLM